VRYHQLEVFATHLPKLRALEFRFVDFEPREDIWDADCRQRVMRVGQPGGKVVSDIKDHNVFGGPFTYVLLACVCSFFFDRCMTVINPGTEAIFKTRPLAPLRFQRTLNVAAVLRNLNVYHASPKIPHLYHDQRVTPVSLLAYYC
jgi:hypothetical protein